jgi:predicted DNA-binding transcriptional regulator AlpA
MAVTDQAGERKRPATRPSLLPPSCPPRGLNRQQAAEYVGMGATRFGEMVKEGLMPVPKRVGGRLVWDRYALDESFEALPDDETVNEWDEGKL